jgi:hypothetical protein
VEKDRCSDGVTSSSGKADRHNIRIWGLERPVAVMEMECDSPKMNVFCAGSRRRVLDPFLSAESGVKGHVYLDMFEMSLMPQLAEEDEFISHKTVLHTSVPQWEHTRCTDRSCLSHRHILHMATPVTGTHRVVCLCGSVKNNAYSSNPHFRRRFRDCEDASRVPRDYHGRNTAEVLARMGHPLGHLPRHTLCVHRMH